MDKIKIVDLFAGMGGFRLGFENACRRHGIELEVVLTSEIKKHAIKVLEDNFEHKKLMGDIRKVNEKDIETFDFLIAGFPCQTFSKAGNQDGFSDTRGTLFFEIERILKEKRPTGFILENVDNLERHDKGRTLKIIVEHLEKIGYKVSYKVLNSKNFGLPQKRKRIYIVGSLKEEVSLDNFKKRTCLLEEILETGLPTLETETVQKILDNYNPKDLYGKKLIDKRGGPNNIHSWDIDLKGKTSKNQRIFLEELLKQRRRKKWAIEKNVKWRDGMPLTINDISTFFPNLLVTDFDGNLKKMLEDLVEKGYLRHKYPIKTEKILNDEGKKISRNVPNKNLEKGYDLITGQLSLPYSKFLNPKGISLTLTATTATKILVVDNGGLRTLSTTEGLRLFGFPDNFKMNVPYDKQFDLFGNTVPINVIEDISYRLINSIFNQAKPCKIEKQLEIKI